MRGNKWIFAGLSLALLAGLAVVACEWGGLRAWYVLRSLRSADESSRAAWVARTVALGPSAVESVVAGLEGDGADNCAEALAAMAEQWAEDARGPALASSLSRLVPRLPEGAKARAYRALAQACVGPVRETCAALLAEGEPAGELQEAALELAASLLRAPGQEHAVPSCRRLARAGLRSATTEARVRAVALSLQPGMDLLEEVARLLRDPVPEVRRVALLAVAPSDLVKEETLLACLHDKDVEVARLAASALRARGLRPDQVEMGRLFSHPSPHQRVQVLDQLREVADADPAVWLRRLSHDPSPAVRCAALRMMSEHLPKESADRIEEMASRDPSPTVAQLARWYAAQNGIATISGSR